MTWHEPVPTEGQLSRLAGISEPAPGLRGILRIAAAVLPEPPPVAPQSEYGPDGSDRSGRGGGTGLRLPGPVIRHHRFSNHQMVIEGSSYQERLSPDRARPGPKGVTP